LPRTRDCDREDRRSVGRQPAAWRASCKGAMPKERLSIWKIREIMRRKWHLKMPHRAIAASVGVSVGVVSMAASRAQKAGLSWADIERLGDAELEARLYRKAVVGVGRPEPDCAWIYRELQCPNATLRVVHRAYLTRRPNGLRYTAFCERYRRWCGRRELFKER